ncbi:hypothetical protein MCOR25_002336 [Pyricularia grisea]|uniref:peptidylprolyl isomerase n=1 Tax=Pyricularia grisea TaxID=148305 RepID=A0A6P8ATB0_PYRGI|nr:uncharacterized protein PgNI_09798 [Pyricularia grisea]KAI6378091.1 hypothetical protein MCOR25_002336 [Pyricularia grisea]TLD05374.1 hypothetical protein PgNI_09798 [Pyricularia grisea]
MSTIYNTEPQPTASVILHTSVGELSVELFAKQTPLTSRNFLQRCLDGYYDNTIFHRLVPGFIVQGGDPTGTGNGGESIYDGGALSGDLDPWPMDQRRGKNAGPLGINFKDEFHSRLKFSRRGLLGMANEGAPDTNGSQFFFTFDKADELNGKNTMFGRVAGDTIYNLQKIGEAEVAEGTERPLYPIKLERVEILVNPFDDMKKRERVAKVVDTAPAPTKKPKKRKVGKQLLSFGDEVGESEELPILKKPKFDTRIVMDDEATEAPVKRSKGGKPAESKDASLSEPSAAGTEAGLSAVGTKDAIASSDSAAKLRDAPQKPNESSGSPPPLLTRIQPRYGDEDPAPGKKNTAAKDNRTALEKANDEIATLKASMRRNVNSEPIKEEKKSALELMIPETSTRGRKRRAGANNNDVAEEQKTMNLLKAFQSKLADAPSTNTNAQQSRAGEDATGDGVTGGAGEKPAEGEGEVCDLHFIINCQSCQAWDKLEGKDESDDEGWMSHALSFAADKLGKDLNYRKKAEEELIVIDPREKARSLREEKRQEKGSRTGGSGRAWDQARNAQLARSSNLAGRGAK